MFMFVILDLLKKADMSNLLERQNSTVSNEKTAKYDRQLRLWGNHGQTNLEKSRVCLINATAVGN